jgi:peptidoglycan hydrolase-like protein with peptidoglycan-binding domain
MADDIELPAEAETVIDNTAVDAEVHEPVDVVEVSDAGEAVEAPKTKKKPAAPKRRPSPGGQAVSGQDVDDVSLERIVFKNVFARKSMSVHHMQRRLAELGYADAYTDKDGWYGELTMMAVAAFQADEGIAGDGIANRATLDALFYDDPNVRVID